MGSFLHNLLFFIVAIGVLITVHEYGHFWVARRAGVKVLRFSIGFGKPLLTWRRGADRTEYVVAALPLGGYVKMLDEREGDVAPEEAARAFNRRPLPARAAVVVAGPLFNFAFALFAYWLAFVIGVSGAKPIVGEVAPGSIADRAGLHLGDELVAIGGEPTPTWESAVNTLLGALVSGEPVALEVRDERGRSRLRRLHTHEGARLAEGGKLLENLGIAPYRPKIPAVVERVEPGSPAERAGLRPGDRVAAADGKEIEDWSDWVEYVRARPDTPIRMTVERGGGAAMVELTPKRVETKEGAHGQIGAAVRVPDELFERLRGELRYGPIDAVGAAAAKTWEMSLLTLRMLGKMVTGELSLANVSGPLSIAQYAGQSAAVGFTAYLTFLALISVSLGVLNLLPVPVLDGGHLLFYLIEGVKGSPLSETAQGIGQRIGVALLLALMSVAFYNDIARLLG